MVSRPERGPLAGIRVLDMTGLGPGPYCTMLLGDLGADVVRIERPGSSRFREPEKFVPHRSRRSIVIDITAPDGRDLVLRLVEGADVLVEGNRPGVMERLGLGPDSCAARNSRLVYARMTGWGQSGPLARNPGHDVNYLSVVGALSRFRRSGERPMFPLNLAADYGGGGAILAFGIACALFERAASGLGQVIDGAMIDGVAGQLSLPLAYSAMGRLKPAGENFNDSGSHFYEVYETADARFLALGALEPKFYAAVLDRLGLGERDDLPDQNDSAQWPAMKQLFASIIGSRTLDEWVLAFEGAEACVDPVLELEEAVQHPHNIERRTFVEVDGVTQPGVAPRFSRTPGAIARRPPATGENTDEILVELGLSDDEITDLRSRTVVA
jgi:alpha-methylacyl-CoA racemase